jgi:epoxyqueuosine reductase
VPLEIDANSTPRQRGDAVLKACADLGFAAAGIVPAQPSALEAELREWLGAGCHGEMEYMERDLAIRLDPRGLLEGTRSFVMVADQYAPRGPAEPSIAEHGRVARYARGRNYHDVVRARLHRLADSLREAFRSVTPGDAERVQCRTFVDTAPVLERELAQLAGLGWHAKNTMLIHPRLGSYLVLGGMATNLELEPPAAQLRMSEHCGTCTRCIDACPTGAITPLRVDARKCVSYLTIEHRSEIDANLHAGMGDWMYGCDICQEVCPHNSPRPEAERGSAPGAGTPNAQGVPASANATMSVNGLVNQAYAPRVTSLPLLDVLGWTEESRGAAIRTTAMKRASLAMMKRNALIAAGNALRAAWDERLAARVREIEANANEADMVRRTARAVLATLRSSFG